jgi:hypothetical protein
MATFLNHDQLRRHALPAFLAPGRDRRTAPRRVRLTATWHIGANGRPTCGWAASQTAGPGLVLDLPSG